MRLKSEIVAIWCITSMIWLYVGWLLGQAILP